MVSLKTSRPASRRSVPLVSGLGIPPITLDLDGDLSRRPHPRDRRSQAALARHFLLGDSELMALAGPDHELAFSAVADLATDGIVKEAMAQSIDDDPFEERERLGELAAATRCGYDSGFIHRADDV